MTDLGGQIRTRLGEQLAELTTRTDGARKGTDPEHVHQMRVAVRRARAALKAGMPLPELDAELKWLGSSLGAVRDLDVQLDNLRAQAVGFDADELRAVETLLHSLVTERGAARRKMLNALRGKRYTRLLKSLAEASKSGKVVETPEEEEPPPLISVIRKPHRKLMRAAEALGEDPPDDDLHELRIHGKRLRYAAEMAEPAARKKIRALVKATKDFQDILGDHQDAVIAEETIRRLLSDLGDGVPVDVVFVAGRLVERERAKKSTCRAHWRSALADVDTLALTVLGTDSPAE
ncbi:CHAD domain-containing protein [Actinokineospora auranticolor]|uniref:CHAD domain-containing protein n=1 Tax=Actinokineospora auranticolor TaxID=155976 RepID=A0A2S6GYA4_9PSEU|nr:CHAD domain-containing protein [Actinokineospora auranticolor]PPK70157.1 CHAD domain-containing protein [Actinokineospora auranticolor]